MLYSYNSVMAKTAPWQEIEDFYMGLISQGWKMYPMVSLIKFIRVSNLEKRLYAFTSLDKLIVTIYNPAERDREALHIEFIQYSGKWHFEYFPKPYESKEMERYYPEEEGIDKFCQFIEWLRW